MTGTINAPSVSVDGRSEQRLYATCDPLNYEGLLTADELTHLRKLRGFLEAEGQPLLDDYWERGEFPAQLIKPMAALDLISPPSLTTDGAAPRSLYEGFRNLELVPGEHRDELGDVAFPRLGTQSGSIGTRWLPIWLPCSNRSANATGRKGL